METPPPRRPERTLLVRLPSSKEETPPPLSGCISLDCPRPAPTRTQNLYVEAPLPNNQRHCHLNQIPSTTYHHISSSNSKSEFKQPSSSIINTQPVIKRPHHPKQLSDSIIKSSSFSNISSVVSLAVPATASASLPTTTTTTTTTSKYEGEEEESIICRECGKCKCQACATPKKLPRKWICSGKWLCSPESTIETISCYCCVKGAFYHCQKDSEIEWESSPLSCSSRDGQCCLRWTALGTLSLLMPCLWCYIPLDGCLRLANYIYGRSSVSGCRCPGKDPSSRQPGLILRDP
ncbi:uncharacterized protein sty [Lepeophtheirus salmonis]|nr:protein sprouty homolog 3-like [Lepeophtheirus salmonis]